MTWKQLKGPKFSLPSRQDVLIIIISLLIALLVIAFFALRS